MSTNLYRSRIIDEIFFSCDFTKEQDLLYGCVTRMLVAADRNMIKGLKNVRSKNMVYRESSGMKELLYISQSRNVPGTIKIPG